MNLDIINRINEASAGLVEPVSKISGFIWNNALIFLLVGTGIFFTIYSKGIQFRKFGHGFKTLFKDFSLFGEKADKDGMSSFQAVATAIAAQIGTGNMVGASTALIMGGPGALFWMWLAALFGMATIFYEAILAQHYKTRDDDGQVVGGPAYYISRGLNNKWLAAIFAVLIILALGFMGNMVQSNSIGAAFEIFNIAPWVTGIIVAVLSALIIFAGISGIASFAEKVVPIMAICYLVVGLAVILSNASAIPGVFVQIFQGAFSTKAAIGGAVGVTFKQAARYGIARGLFSNEAGMGSTPHAHAVATVREPADQGSVAIVSVFIDTFIVLNISAISMLVMGAVEFDPAGNPIREGINVLQEAFARSFLGTTAGPMFISICLAFFAFTTVVGWYYFAETNVRYLFGKKALVPFKIIAVICIFFGSILKLDLVWEMSDLFNGLMVIPNLIGVLLLAKVGKKILADYDAGIPYEPLKGSEEFFKD